MTKTNSNTTQTRKGFSFGRNILRSIFCCLLLWAAGTGARAQTGTFNINTGVGDGSGYTWDGTVLTIHTNGDYIITGTGVATHSNKRIVVSSGVTADITLNNVNIEIYNTNYAYYSAFDMAGATVNLKLEDDNFLKGTNNRAALRVPSGATLTIDGTGSLTAISAYDAAGIGGNRYESCGNVYIYGGTVTATGTYNYSTGIGGGGYGGSGGNITISGGTVTATGGLAAAGIGGSIDGAGGNITISGGTVTATGGGAAAGIGGGSYGGSYGSSGGNITISGGTVTATGGSYSSSDGGAGIGGGSNGNGGTIIISGGTVTATGGQESAGIGGGNRNPSSGGTIDGGGGNITVSGGTIIATGKDGAEDIGKAQYGSSDGTLTITGGSIHATRGSIGATPTNDGGSGYVYLNTLTVGSSANANAAITAGSINGVPCAQTANAASGVYGIKDVVTDGEGKVYFWLPASGGDEMVKLTADATEYRRSYEREANNDNAEILAPPYGITLSETGTYTFPSAAYGYGAQTAKTITVTNAGYQATGDLTVAVNPSAAFNVSTPVSSIAADATGSFTVTPKTGLSAGTHTATVEVSGGNNISATFNVSFEVTPKNLTITLSVNNKEYDGGTAATFAVTPALNGVISPDVVTLSGGTPTFADKNAGNGKAINFSPAFSLTGAQAGNYTLTQPSGITANITAKELTINNVGVNNKVYNGNTEAAFAGTPALVGVISPDNVTLSGGTPTFADKNAGNGKAIGFSPAFSLGGAQAGNYTLTQPSGVTANITAKDISVTGVTIAPKTYDGTTVATVTGVSFIGLVETLTKDVDYSVSGAFNSASAGSGNKTVQATVTLLSTTTAGNYNLTNGTGYSLTGQSIAKKDIIVTGGTITPKIYDGTASATVTELTFAGLENGETFTIITDYAVSAAAFTDASVGSNKTVRMNVALVSNPTTDNYNLTNGINYDLTGQRIDEFLLDLEALEDLGVTVDLTKTPVEVTVPDNITGLGDITVRYNGRTRIPDEPGTYEVTVDITPGANYAGATGIVVGTITIPEPVDPEPAQREVILPSLPGITTDPPAGSYLVSSGDDFVFTLTPAATQALLTPVIAIGRINGAGDDGVEITPNGDGSYTVRIRQVRQPLTVVIDFTTANNAIGSNRVWSHAGTLHITAATNGEARIYSVSGGLAKAIPVAAGATVSAPLPAGFYVVVLDGKPYKVFVE